MVKVKLEVIFTKVAEMNLVIDKQPLESQRAVLNAKSLIGIRRERVGRENE